MSLRRAKGITRLRKPHNKTGRAKSNKVKMVPEGRLLLLNKLSLAETLCGVIHELSDRGASASCQAKVPKSISCPRCHSPSIKKNGAGKQRKQRQLILPMTMNGSGIRDISRVQRVSLSNVLKTIRVTG